ncbi:hypothetical protein D3C72_2446380 [compost metagenome]
MRPVPISLMPFSAGSRTMLVFVPENVGCSVTAATTFRLSNDGAVVMTMAAAGDSWPVESIHFAR